MRRLTRIAAVFGLLLPGSCAPLDTAGKASEAAAGGAKGAVRAEAAGQVPVGGKEKLPDVARPMGEEKEVLERLTVRAIEREAAIHSYTARLTRREEVNGALLPRETILVEWRREPWSIAMKWADRAHRGREAIYVKGKYGDRMQVLEGSFLFQPRFSLAIDGSVARSESRYLITEAHLGFWTEQFKRHQAREAAGDYSLGVPRYAGMERRPEDDREYHHIVMALADGSRQHCYIDPASELPLVSILRNSEGRLVEYHYHDRLEINAAVGEEVFDPVVRWRTGRP